MLISLLDITAADKYASKSVPNGHRTSIKRCFVVVYVATSAPEYATLLQRRLFDVEKITFNNS